MRKKEGFQGERSIVLPRDILKKYKTEDIFQNLYLTDIGFYPQAKDHFREREGGCGQYIFIYCVEGQGWFKTENKQIVEAGTFFIIPKHHYHSYGSCQNNPWSIYWVHFNGESAHHYYQKYYKHNQGKPLKIDFLEERIQLFEDIFETLEMGYQEDNLIYSSSCLANFLGSFIFYSQFARARTENELNPLDKSIHFMKENLDKNLSLADLAHNANYSKSYYCRIFKNKTGWPPIAYYNHLKIQKACQLLDNTDLRINQIAYKLGFKDPYYFSRMFKKIMNLPPKYYRDKQTG